MSLEWRFSRGRFLTPALLGYDRVEVPDGHGGHKKVLKINEDEAQTVRLMYYMLLNGFSTADIANTLNELRRETGLKKVCGRVSTAWTTSNVCSLLRNERYCGDVIARKTWTPDFHDHRSKKNNGKKNKYYQPGHHEAIVTRAQWNAAQRILNSHRYRHTGSYLPMRVVRAGALTGYVSINRAWAGYEPDEYYRVSSIAMGLAEGELEPDLEQEHLPEGGRRLSGTTDDNGVQRIAREMTQTEKAVRAQLEGRTLENEEAREIPKINPGFQVVSGHMFSHAFEPAVSITPGGLLFNTTCISRLDRAEQPGGRQQYVELLLNAVERTLVVRPCADDYPNGMLWVDSDGKGRSLGAKAFCTALYAILGWSEGYGYRVPAVVRRKGDEVVLFFDLDNYIGRERVSHDEPANIVMSRPVARVETEETRGIFFGADDDTPQEVVETEEDRQRRREMEEYERKRFGTPLFEHNSELRLTAIDDEGQWDVMAEAEPLGDDYRVDDTVIEALQEKLAAERGPRDAGDMDAGKPGKWEFGEMAHTDDDEGSDEE